MKWAFVLLFLPVLSFGQNVPIVEFDFFMEEVSEDVDSVVVQVIITEPDTAEVRAYIINEVSSNATIGTDFEMESPLELIFPPNSTESQFFTISITDDDHIEGLEMIMLAVESVVGGSAITGTEGEHVVAILDNDSCIIEILNGDTSACTDGSPIILEANPAGGTFSGAGVIGEMFYPQLCDPGTSMITYSMDQLGCSGSAQHAIDVEVCAGLWEPQKPLSHFPNPADHFVSLQLTGESQITVVDVSGKVVIEKNLNGNATMDISGLPPGSYSIQVIGEDGTSFSKLIVAR